MIITAKKFIGAPLEAFRRADKGEDVTITHARYPDIEFKLTSKAKVYDEESALIDGELNNAKQQN